MKKRLLFVLAVIILTVLLCLIVSAEETVPENYTVNEKEYIIYSDVHYEEVLAGIKSGTLENKTVVLGCDIETKFDFVMDCAIDITIDLNNHTLANTYVSNKSGDFDLQHEDAIIRVKNGKMTSTFCMFIFRTAGQIYGENVDIVSREECVYQYGGHTGVISLKNCTIDITLAYSSISLASCGGKGGILYQIENCRFDGLNIHCARPGSYVKNCTVYDRELFIDSWHSHGENSSDVTVTLTNVISEQQIRLNDPRVDPVLYDCTYPKVVLGGNQLIVAYTRATCTEAGSKIEYKGSATGVVDEQYALDNPAFGHEEQCVVAYENGYLFSGYVKEGCLRCGDYVEKTLMPIFNCLGYSMPEDGGKGIVLSYTVDFDALSEYEGLSGATIEFGFAVAISEYLGNKAIIDENGTVATLDRGSVVKAELDRKNDYVDLKISGFTSEQSNYNFVMGMYVITSTEEGNTVAYIQSEKAPEGSLYSTVTFK